MVCLSPMSLNYNPGKKRLTHCMVLIIGPWDRLAENRLPMANPKILIVISGN